jgi:hypothetical protein
VVARAGEEVDVLDRLAALSGRGGQGAGPGVEPGGRPAARPACSKKSRAISSGGGTQP